jgi:hypothetical protein
VAKANATAKAKVEVEAEKMKPAAVEAAAAPVGSRGVSRWCEALGLDEDTPLSTVVLAILLALMLAWQLKPAYV